MFEPRIIPECYADTLLIKYIGYEAPNHQHGIGEVANVMIKYYKNKKVIGIIDDDKTKPKYFDGFRETKRGHNLIVKKRPGTEHYLIVVCRDFEAWIEYAGNQKSVPRPFPNEDKKFRDNTKDFNVEKNNKITNYINTIKQRESPAFLQLKEFIEEILED